ncbi:MAG: NADH:ubiquinone oxidoreductase subunit N, partial [Chloroflexi bacterium]|nr:NADH:ubiquinone oxidoreductase subunit N [Chloroflexota bacterium]
MNLWLLVPELTLFAAAVAVLFGDLLPGKRKGLPLFLTLLGVFVAAVFAGVMWRSDPQVILNGML